MNKPNLIISACLDYAKCRYNGDVIPFPWARELEKFVNIITVCPEVEMGLGTPRPTVRLAVNDKSEKRMVDSKTKEDHTDKYNKFFADFENRALDLDGAILKAKSPSCGLVGVKLYNGDFPQEATKGLFAAGLIEKYPYLVTEEEGRLRNYILRDHFLTKLFCVSAFKQAFKEGNIANVMDLHAAYKYLFMGYNQNTLRELGRMLAKYKDYETMDALAQAYLKKLLILLKREPSKKNRNNAILHCFGYFKKHINAQEKAYFLKTLESYNQERKPFHAVTSIIEAWTVRYQIEYLSNQKLFNPYPMELMNVLDSGKGYKI